MDFAQALANAINGAAEDDDDKDAAPALLPEAVIADLRELCARYTAGCPFRVGDLVTPRRGYSLSGSGDPRIIVEVAPTPIRNFDSAADCEEWASNTFGARLDIRVAHISPRGQMVMHWGESWMYEPYTGPAS
jgi:hypothetical protein